MKNPLTNILVLALATGFASADVSLTKPIAKPDLVFEEKDGLVVVEAEHFFKQELTDKRAFYLTTTDKEAGLKPDADPNHVAGASGGAYLEVLPDTRKNHGEKLIHGENFINQPGKMAVLSYKVHFNTPGRYYVWARIHSTGTEDNGMHVGINGTWPESGQRMQWTAKRHWKWNSKQRTEKVHGGVKGILYLDVAEPGTHTIHFSMREDGFEFDQWLMTKDKDFKEPAGPVAISKTTSGTAPKPFKLVAAPPKAEEPAKPKASTAKASVAGQMNANAAMTIHDFPDRKRVYVDKDKWFAVNPDAHKDGIVTGPFPFKGGTFDLIFHAVGENDGQSSYEIWVEGEKVGDFTAPLGTQMFEEGAKYTKMFKDVIISSGAMIEVKSKIGSKDGDEFSRARWSHIDVRSSNAEKVVRNRGIQRPAGAPGPNPKMAAKPSFTGDLFGERGKDGDGSVEISGELKQWHKVTLTLDGPFAHEKDNKPNPFTDRRATLGVVHESGSPSYKIPGYFAADGNAGETSAESGTKWRAHFAPDKPGKWNYSFMLRDLAGGKPNPKAKIAEGSFTVAASDKTGRDLRGKGRLQYVGKHHLQFAGDKSWFVKAGADAPETFLAYKDFDGTETRKSPLKTWSPHVKDWSSGDPTWKGGKGKGMIGAINYLSGKGCNVFSFLTYNTGGDGDNVWPHVERDDRLNFDCSKLDQWGVVFDHATAKGMYLHFKLQETENDDNVRGGHKGRKVGTVPAALDGGELGPQRKAYLREIIARYGHNLALNWNLGEENTQTTKQQQDMAQYIADLDPYDHPIVVHTYPNQQDKIYNALLGDASALTGASLQNSNVKDCHWQVVKWNRASAKAGKPWVIGFDEPGTAGEGMPADEGYPGMPKNFNNPSVDDTRKYALWGTLMAGGSGVEYYFGYKLPQNDLVCEDWRSRDKSWDYCAIALDFFKNNDLPLGEMKNENELIGNTKHDNSGYCFAKKGEVYVVYLPNGGERKIDLSGGKGEYNVKWFNPRSGGAFKRDATVKGVKGVTLKAPDAKADWVALIR